MCNSASLLAALLRPYCYDLPPPGRIFALRTQVIRNFISRYIVLRDVICSVGSELKSVTEELG